MSDEVIVLQGEDLHKRFEGVHAVNGLSISLRKGEILGLVGENGAGKSTMLKLLVGEHAKDSGKIFYYGKEVFWKNPYEALINGVGLVHQRPNLVPELTAAENIFLGKEITKNGLLAEAELKKQAAGLLEKYPVNLEFDLTMRAEEMSAGQREVTEILKVLSFEPEILILDEPTASLTMEEYLQLMKILRELNSEKQLSIIYISHRIEEVLDFCTRVVVLRNGKRVGAVDKVDFDKDKIIKMIINRELSEFYPPKEGLKGASLLETKKISAENLDKVDLELHAGEIVGLYGLSGAGMTDFVETVFGIKKILDGELFVHGEKVHNIHPAQLIKKNVYLIPEDRETKGLFTGFTVKENLLISHLSQLLPGFLIRKREEIRIAEKGKDEFGIVCSSLDQEIRSLSGGNQQKVVIAKWLLKECDILMLDDPTSGVDVGTKREVYLILRKLAKQGKGVILVSSDIMEIIGMCDRIYTMRDGAVSSVLHGQDINQKNILENVL